MEHTANDLRINGLGQASGGTYGKINVDGIGTINGSVICNSITANGTLKLKNTLQAGEFRLNGTGSAGGIINGGRIRVDGTLKVNGDVKFAVLDINGMLNASGGAIGEHAKIDGALKLEGNADYEELKVHGQIQVGGMLNAGVIDILMAGPCRAKEIGGERIFVRKKSGSRMLLALLSHSWAPTLTTELIEGDDIMLEETKAAIVRGSSVVIGPGCKIERVEYKNHYEKDPNASVGSSEKI